MRLQLHVTPAQREAIRARLEHLAVVDQLYHESQAEAYRRLKDLYWGKPGVVANIDPAKVPESFRVRLASPEDFPRLRRAVCPLPPRKLPRSSGCMDGVEVVIEDQAPVRRSCWPRSGRPAATRPCSCPAAPPTPSGRRSRPRLEAIDEVAKVTYETAAEAYRRLPDKLRRNGRDPVKEAPLFSPETVPAAFHVALREPVRVAEFHRALCGSRTTGTCAGGLVVFEHARARP